MSIYILRRLLLMIPTIVAIITLCFIIVQFVPGGPVERVIAEITGQAGISSDRISGNGDGGISADTNIDIGKEFSSNYRGSRGLDPEFIEKLEVQFGLNKPVYERYFQLLWNYARFDLGESYFRNASVIDMMIEKMPVSISLGIWITLLSYGISIPLGIRKAVSDGSAFDIWTSGIVIIAYAIPGFLFGVMLVILFAGGSFFDWFPLRGLTSDNFEEMPWPAKIVDYFWHLALPLAALVLSAFATNTLLTKNSFLDEIRKQYVQTARAKGLSENRVLYGHVFRNAMLIIIAGFPAAFVTSFFTGSLLIEVIFNLDGLGLLGFESIVGRDYPVVIGTLYIYSLIGMIMTLISDIIYTMIDPRISFEAKDL